MDDKCNWRGVRGYSYSNEATSPIESDVTEIRRARNIDLDVNRSSLINNSLVERNLRHTSFHSSFYQTIFSLVDIVAQFAQRLRTERKKGKKLETRYCNSILRN